MPPVAEVVEFIKGKMEEGGVPQDKAAAIGEALDKAETYTDVP
jgi:hypothetical protein